MRMLTLLADLRLARLVDELTQQLTRQAYSLVREVCEARVLGMTHAEARGYVWAKTRPIVLAAVSAASVGHPALDPANLALLSERTRERVVRAVLSDLMRDRVRHVNRRRAA
jgi:hypothetical protein